jgi:hypothetical protein
MSIEVKAAREAIERCREYGKENSGGMCMFSERGPVSISVAERLLAAIESLDKRLTDLKQES